MPKPKFLLILSFYETQSYKDRRPYGYSTANEQLRSTPCKNGQAFPASWPLPACRQVLVVAFTKDNRSAARRNFGVVPTLGIFAP
jgi:hypothetical protein